MKAKISEIFQSIQGEGIYQGANQVFVRFFGCNINCVFCDTILIHHEEKTLQEVLEKIYAFQNWHSVSLTGGEPLCQGEFLRLLARELKNRGSCVYLETNGILPYELRRVIDFVDIISMDFKLPSSTKLEAFWKEHERFLRIALARKVFIKAVIGKDTLEHDILSAISLMKRCKASVPFVLQPENPYEDILEEKVSNFQALCRKNQIDVLVLTQIHKKIGVA